MNRSFILSLLFVPFLVNAVSPREFLRENGFIEPGEFLREHELEKKSDLLDLLAKLTGDVSKISGLLENITDQDLIEYIISYKRRLDLYEIQIQKVLHIDENYEDEAPVINRDAAPVDEPDRVSDDQQDAPEDKSADNQGVVVEDVSESEEEEIPLVAPPLRRAVDDSQPASKSNQDGDQNAPRIQREDEPPQDEQPHNEQDKAEFKPSEILKFLPLVAVAAGLYRIASYVYFSEVQHNLFALQQLADLAKNKDSSINKNLFNKLKNNLTLLDDQSKQKLTLLVDQPQKLEECLQNYRELITRHDQKPEQPWYTQLWNRLELGFKNDIYTIWGFLAK